MNISMRSILFSVHALMPDLRFSLIAFLLDNVGNHQALISTSISCSFMACYYIGLLSRNLPNYLSLGRKERRMHCISVSCSVVHVCILPKPWGRSIIWHCGQCTPRKEVLHTACTGTPAKCLNTLLPHICIIW